MALLLALPFVCNAEAPPAEVVESPAPVDDTPAELAPFEIVETEPEPEATPVPEAEQTPLPTLEPGSQNYDAGKVVFEGEIWSILTRRWGLTDWQTAGLMSSLYAESSFCPYNAQSVAGIDDRGKYEYRVGDAVGFGLCQWTSAGRKGALRDYAVDHGDANLVWDFDIQMGYMRNEINLDALKATETLYDATEWAVMVFERPNQNYKNSWPGSRYDIARRIYRAHTGKDYKEPRLRFRTRDGNGGRMPEVLGIDGEAAMRVESNFYWRLTRVPSWLVIERSSPETPDKWERRPCGYAGGTALRFSIARVPALRDATLVFEIYRGGHKYKALRVRYTGPSVAEVLRARATAWQASMDAVYSPTVQD